MNTRNITSLSEQLNAIGIENASFLIARGICFKSADFTLTLQHQYSRELLIVQLYFKKEEGQDCYRLLYYDAALQKQEPNKEEIINGVTIEQLEKLFVAVDWKSVFENELHDSAGRNENKSLETIAQIEIILQQLYELEKTESGRPYSIALKLKYWSVIPGHELFVNIDPIKPRLAITQRFYISEADESITINEAYRFLQNCWLEKQLHEKRKSQGNHSVQQHTNSKQDSGSAKNPKKKYSSKRKTGKDINVISN